MISDWGSLAAPSEYQSILQAGEPLDIRYDENALLFAGTIESVSEKRVGEQADIIQYDIECSDWHQILDRRKIARAYENKTIQYIIDDIIDDYLKEDGITIGGIAVGETVIGGIVFNYCSITDAIKKIADKIGAVWYVDFDKKLYIKERSEELAPWNINDNSRHSNLSVKNHRENYRNVQYITKARSETDTQIETQVADGQLKVFLTAYDILKVPTIWVGAALQTVGIKDVDTGKQFYWSKGRNEVYAEAPPGAGVSVKVEYIGEVPVVMKIENKGEITARALIEGNSGKYENVEIKEGLTTITAISELGLELLRQYGLMGREVSFNTYIPGLSAGQIITVNLPEHNLNNIDMLITRVSLSEENFKNNLRYSISAVTGEAVGGWVEFFRKLTIPEEDLSQINVSDRVTIFEGFTKIWNENERPNIFIKVYPAEDLFPAENLYPMFNPGEEVKYLSWHTDAGENGRKYRTAQIRSQGSIKTTVLLFDTEANVHIKKLGWWGGHLASLTLGTGTQIDLKDFDIDKNKLIILQIQRTDLKGW